MKATKYIWKDGEWLDWDKAQLHVLTHSLHYGGAAFEGIRLYETQRGPALFRVQDHYRRLLFSAEQLYMEVPYSVGELVAVTQELVAKNQLTSGYVRPIIVYGSGQMGVTPSAELPVSIYIAAWDWPPLLGSKPIRLSVSSFKRLPSTSIIPEAKHTGNYLSNQLASQEARRRGYDEALVLDQDDYIAEATAENIFFVKDGKLYTPQLGNALPGITRDTIVQLASDNQYGIQVVNWKMNDLKDIDEVFLTGTGAEVIAVSEIDDLQITFDFGPITRTMRDMYLELVSGEIPDNYNWLTYIH